MGEWTSLGPAENRARIRARFDSAEIRDGDFTDLEVRVEGVPFDLVEYTPSGYCSELTKGIAP